MDPATIIGHQERLAGLAKALQSGRLNHAYLFVGPAGVGKTTVATAFAQAMLCSKGTLPACGECRSCTLFNAGNHPDFRRVGLDGTNIKMDLIRELQRDVGFHPLLSARKVFLLSPMEMMTEVAANGLLKTLEEPPPSVHFLGVAVDESALLSTIRSRMSPVWLAPVAPGEIVRGLRDRGVDEAAALKMADRSRGLPGAAISMLQEEVAESHDWGRVLQDKDIRTLLGKTSEAEKLTRADVEIWLEEMTVYYRNRLRGVQLIDDLQSIQNCLTAVRVARERLAANVNARLLLEALFLRLCGE